MATRYCPKCGAEVFASETRCKQCGNTDFVTPAAAKGQPAGAQVNVVAVPFVPAITAGGNEAKQSADQLTALIAHYDGQGFAFRHLESVTTLRNNGCLAALFGSATTVVSVQAAIFERKQE